MTNLRVARRRLLAAVAVAIFVWNPASAHAVASREKALFGPIGIATGQLLRVNVYATGNPNDPPWSFLVRLFDRRGALVGERRLQLAPGATGWLELRVGDIENLPPDALGRRTLRAEIVGFNPQPDPPGAWFTTLEVIDARTGRTTVLLGGPDTVPEGQP